MKLKQVLLGLFIAANAVSFAQDNKKEVLFTINDKPYYTEEFARVYKKNLDLVKDDSQKDLNHYLDLFIGYKLKVEKANKLGLQNNANYQNELKSYRTQLSKNYVTDSKVTKELIEEAYKRSLKEIKASHILFTLDENAEPADTLKVYQKAMDVRKKIVNGENFETIAAQYSQDPSVKDNKGNLGWFSVFRMVYPFESAAYKTKKGEVSLPVRTRFGYHLIKVNDVRENRGQVTVAHIMTLNGQNPTEAATAKSTIEDVYKKLKQGEGFESLAQQFSQDKSTSNKGGELQRFGSGELSSEEFEDVAFSLTQKGEISMPFQSQFGWHIVKLIEKYPVRPFEEMEAEFDNKIRKDDRSRLINASMNEMLRKKYPVKRNDKVYKKILPLVTDKYYKQEWEVPSVAKEMNEQLLTVNNDKTVTASVFLNYVASQQKANHAIKPISKLMDKLYAKFVEEQLTGYYNDNLEKEFPEFSNVMDEYRDGLLLFDLMEKEIWTKAKTDTLGLKAFYEKNIANYQWKDRVEANVFSSTKSDVIKKTEKYLKKNKSIDFIKETFNTKGAVEIMVKSGIFEVGDAALPKHQNFNVGITDVSHEGNYYFITQIIKKLDKGPKKLEETKGKVINDYQQYLEANWVGELKKEFTVKINQDVFNKVKSQLQTK
ncbi:peptidyl-prolyl cis-trans isomerase [Flavobacterium saliperosum S13]|uniref:Peptidyl-prolyl cis-trans isomerase SurA n=2 Tax=Flavobacterium saliperosum TaxID=329186 RepID=A0A1G4V463_9FLAO|nr:peptidylprolyl isomerase [Flavobacterium saliperosum]ESU27750.1 peptidyl-prolyl cis-trans isomerase [Flavobacterium saliperosum S13]SCX00904.1 peptidyl-prolyl cis-trans isomerase SurA [Flavobacterium saliperosum]